MGGGYSADGVFQLLHRGTDAYDVIQRIPSVGIALESKILPAEVHLLQRAIDGELDFIHQARRLANVIGGSASFHGFDGGFIVVHRGDEDYGGVGRNLVGIAQDFDAINVRHFYVGDDHVEECAVEFPFGSFA